MSFSLQISDFDFGGGEKELRDSGLEKSFQ